MYGPKSQLDLLVRTLERDDPLSENAAAAIRSLDGPVRTIAPSGYIMREGESPTRCMLLLSGFAYRQKLTCDGARQIVGLRIPGDPLDLQSLFMDVADHNVQALTQCRIMYVPRAAVERLLQEQPAITRAIVVNILIEASIGREWLLNVGRRDARTRLAHLLCEFAHRMDAQQTNDDDGCEMPLTQEQLGDALGLTSVHVNRMLKALEREGALVRRGRKMRFDRVRMERIADFSSLYLHSAVAGRPTD